MSMMKTCMKIEDYVNITYMLQDFIHDRHKLLMISAFFTGVVVAIPTSLVMMKLLNSSLFINNSELLDMNQKISVIIHQLDDFREERREEREKFLNVSDDTK